MLGLVKVDKGEVRLTEFGLKFQKTSKQKVKLLKDQLSKIEPFRTALKLASASKKGVTISRDLRGLALEGHSLAPHTGSQRGACPDSSDTLGYLRWAHRATTERRADSKKFRRTQ